MTVQRSGRHWLLARHGGRAALVGTAADAASCRVASRLADVHGHTQLDWVMLLDPVAPDTLDCWRSLAGHVAAPHQGHAALAMGQRLTSAGLTLELLAARGQPMLLRSLASAASTPGALGCRDSGTCIAAGFRGTWLGSSPVGDG